MNPHSLTQVLDMWFAWIWKTSIQATVLIALVLLIQLCFKRLLAPRWGYALGLLVLLRLALPVGPAASFSIFNLAHRLPTENLRMGKIGRMELPQPAINLPPIQTTVLPAASVEHASSQNLSTPFSIAEFLWLSGCLVMLGNATRQQWNLSRQLRDQPPLTDSRLIALLEICKSQLGVKRSVALLPSATLNTPALFGILRPRLLLPEKMLRQLDDDELRLIFLHELTHFKRGDVLVNWAAIFLRSLHWFNPAVWLAMKRLRADQELACDAAVLSRLGADERRRYGATLLKLLADFSASPFSPGLVPFITHKQIIKRRITMISKFKPASRFALVLSVALIVTVCCLTFTRAADNPNVPTSATNASQIDSGQLDVQLRKVNAVRNTLAQISFEAEKGQRELNDLRKKLGIPVEVAEGRAVSNSLLEQYQSNHLLVESQYVREKTLLEQLRRLNPDQLSQAMPTVAPDSILNQLLQDELAARAKLVGLRATYGESHPEVTSAIKLHAELAAQIDLRIKGMLAGMEAHVNALKAAMEDATDKFQIAKKADNESFEKYQPFFQAKRDLENLQKSRDELMNRLRQEDIELQILRNSGHN